MGKNNRQRRAAKAKRRAHRQGPRRSWHADASWSNDPFTTRELAAYLLELAGSPPSFVDEELVAGATERLCTIDRAVVSREAERRALQLTSAAWDAGWQPAELARQVQRTANVTTRRFALVAVAADHARRRAATLDPRWIEQLDRLDLPTVHQASGWLAEWAASEPADWRLVVRTVVAYLRCAGSLTRLTILIPPPGSRAPDATIDLTSTTSDPMLERVRALLAQAESTTFEAEAEAFTAKAQELMTRHAIDRALLSARAGGESPVTVRVPIDEPYVDAKSLLLQCVADSSRCRSVFHERYAMSAVVGFAADVAATEMLFTSLLVQAQTAMQAAAATAPAGARARSRSFRSAFLVAYAHRIAERLAAINAAVVTDVEAETNRSILPVLAARSSAVDAAVDEIFGALRPAAVRGGYDLAGWASGHLAADRAQLTFGDLPAGEPARSASSTRVEVD